ncbi:MAG: Asp-tRNA(Asn)/Glu-tRNA(Gln) amidotransferase subunit GatB, partial [Actinomycetes bacterium]
DEPINVGGWLDLPDGSRVGIERAHMEEDTGKSTHVGGGGRIHEATHSLVDYNWAGVPLVEIVSRPDIASADQARDYVNELRAVLVATGASDGKMEEGSLRVDANVSVRRAGEARLGTRCEVKNLNSTRSLARAVEHEAARQVALLAAGGSVAQETRHWDEGAGVTHSLRSKEEAFDYRYFPEPDLVPVAPDAGWIDQVAAALPARPARRRDRLAALLDAGGDAVRGGEAARGTAGGGVGAPPSGGGRGWGPVRGGEAARGTADRTLVTTVVELGLDDLVVGAVAAGADPRLALTRVANEAASRAEAARGLDPPTLAAVVGMESAGQLTATQAKAVLGHLIDHGGDPAEVVRSLGYEALSAGTLSAAVDEVVAAHPSEWERWCAGEDKVAGFFVGQVMKATRGRADGKAVTVLLRERRG